MSPRTLIDSIVRPAPVLRTDTPVREAAQQVIASELPALPVVDARGRLAGVFGEREFIAAVFPGYLSELHYAGFVRRSLDEELERRAGCGDDPVGRHMTSEHVDVAGDWSDVQVAEVFLHHRVLIVPVVEGGAVTGVVTRSDFFERLAERFLAKEDG